MKSKGENKNNIKNKRILPSSENFFKHNFDIANENFEQIYCIPVYNKSEYSVHLYTNGKLHKVKYVIHHWELFVITRLKPLYIFL